MLPTFDVDIPAVRRPSTVTLRWDDARRPHIGLKLADVKRILLVKCDHLGDWILFTPFLDNLRRNAPQAVIDALVLDLVFDLAVTAPQLDRVFGIVKKDGDSLTLRARDEAEIAGFRRAYADGGYDLAMVPRWDTDFDQATQIAAGSRAGVILGFSESCTRRKTVMNKGNDAFYTHVIEDRRPVHEAVHNLALIEAMGGATVSSAAHIGITPDDERAAARFHGRILPDDGRPLLAVAPFAAELKRTLPLAEMAARVREICARFNPRVVIVGAGSDRLAALRLAASIGGDAQSAAGHLTIRQTAALVRQCEAMIAVDSGPAHIAAAAGTPVAVLSCHPRDGSPHHANAPQRFAPWGDTAKIRVLQPATAVAPCRGCCTAAHPHCILSIDEQAYCGMMDFIGKALMRADRPAVCSV